MVAAPASLDTLCINSIRMLAVDAINKSNSGHRPADGLRTHGLRPLGQVP